MKKTNILKFATATAIVITLSSLTFNLQRQSLFKHKESKPFSFSKISIGMNKAMAAAPAAHHQTVYEAAKAATNTQVNFLVDAVNRLFAGAKITSCDAIPAASGSVIYSDGSYDLYSSAVGGKTFPITIAGLSATYGHKLELKLKGTVTTIGNLYVDCATGAAEVRYLGQLEADERNLAVAYYEDSSGYQNILMGYDYLDSTDHTLLGLHYVESASNQTVKYAYQNTTIPGGVVSSLAGTLTADSSGTVTDAVDGAIGDATENSNLTSLVSKDFSHISTLSISL